MINTIKVSNAFSKSVKTVSIWDLAEKESIILYLNMAKLVIVERSIRKPCSVSYKKLFNIREIYCMIHINY